MLQRILHLDDDLDDVYFLKHAYKRAGIARPLLAVSDGQEAINYLEGAARSQSKSGYPLVSLVLLDLKLPRVSGLEVIRWIRSRPALEALPVIVLTSSEYPPDLERARALGANACLQKPAQFDGYREIIEQVERWLKRAACLEKLDQTAHDLAA